MTATLRIKSGFVVLACFFVSLRTVHADTIYVNRNGPSCAGNPEGGEGTQSDPYCRIQDGIDKARLDSESPDTVLVASGQGEYTGEGNRDLRIRDQAVTVRCDVIGGSPCVINCQNVARGFTFSNDETRDVIVQGFTIRNGRDLDSTQGGGIAVVQTSPQLLDLVVEDCSTPEGGGGMYVQKFSGPLIERCTFRRNTASEGAGIYLDADIQPVVIKDCGILDNGLIIPSGGLPATGRGGGVWAGPGITVRLRNTRIERNQAVSNGGGVFLAGGSSSNYSLVGCTVAENVTVDFGGGIGTKEYANIRWTIV